MNEKTMKDLRIMYDFVSDSICENRRMVAKNDLIGFIDENGKEVINPQYSSATNFEDGCSICVFQNYGYWENVIIDKYGYKVYNGYQCKITYIGNGLFKVRRKDNYYGIADNKGNEVIPVDNYYTSIDYFPSVNIFVAKTDMLYRIIDREGKILKQMTAFKYKIIDFIDSHTARVSFDGIEGTISF